MGDSEAGSESAARYVLVNDIAYGLADGCVRTFWKRLLSTDRIEIHQTSIRGRGAAEDYGVCATSRTAYVLSGTADLRHDDVVNGDMAIRKGHLIVIPSGTRWGEQLWLNSDELVLLEVASTNDGHRSAPAPEAERGVHVVDPEKVAPYAPAGHEKTRNRCLFVDEHIELIEGLIERGGGAERHSHRDNEQVLYVLNDLSAPLLIHYPNGTPHGTGGGISETLRLLVIYSPPLGESRNALA